MKARAPHKTTRGPQWRSHVNYPGRLATVIAERIIELERGTFSIYAIELVCYDLHKRREHSITSPLFQKSLELQDAIDRQVIRNYRPFTAGAVSSSSRWSTIPSLATSRRIRRTGW
jgi:hypothetical protein